MRKKVQKAAKELGYEPDIIAQSLRSGITNTIGFVIRDISNPMFALLARSCEQELRKNGYSMILINSDGSTETEAKNFELLRRRRVDAVIASLVSENHPAIKQNLLRIRAPIVLLDRQINDFNASAVLVNHSQGTYEAVSKLIGLGHRYIAFVTGSENVHPTRSRLEGIKRAYEEANLKLPEEMLATGGFDEGYAVSHARHLLSSNPKPTAIIAGGLGALMGIMKVIREKDLRIGVDLALVALDELPYLEFLVNDISTVYRDPETIGREAALLVLERLQGLTPRTSFIQTRYVERGSSKGKVNE
jgi:LacI family transcriptional regulator